MSVGRDADHPARGAHRDTNTNIGHTMILVEMLIPVADNSKVEFSAAELSAFEGVLVEVFGGFSCKPGLIKGGWAEGDVVMHDDSRVYVLAISSLLKQGADVVAVAEIARRMFRQEAIFVSYNGIAEIL